MFELVPGSARARHTPENFCCPSKKKTQRICLPIKELGNGSTVGYFSRAPSPGHSPLATWHLPAKASRCARKAARALLPLQHQRPPLSPSPLKPHPRTARSAGGRSRWVASCPPEFEPRARWCLTGVYPQFLQLQVCSCCLTRRCAIMVRVTCPSRSKSG